MRKGITMIRVQSRPLRLIAAAVAIGVLGAACGSSGGASAKGKVLDSTTTTTIAKGADTTAAVLRSTLNGLLEEHVYLASAATGAALAGRSDEFTAAAAALDGNSNAITANITAVFGSTAGQAFDPLWKKHIAMLVAYTQGLAAHDGAKSAQAISDLTQYTKDFGAFINSASPKLPKETVVQLVKTHVFTLKDVIDAQAAKDWTKAYTDERTAAAHMAMIANGLATTVVAQFPAKF